MPIRNALLMSLLLASSAHAAASGEVPAPAPSPAVRGGGAAPQGGAEVDYNDGVRLTASGEWARAEAAYRRALRAREDFPEAWNGLGHALKQQRKFAESLTAYQKALVQRPQYPQALEYLGETYVAMGKLGEARETLGKLKPLDPTLAAQLERVIDGGTANWRPTAPQATGAR